MNAQLRRSFYVFVAGFVALVAMMAYWQVYARESLANNPNNSLQTRRSLEAPRGLILAGDGETVLARSDKRETSTGTVYDRVYPQGDLYSNIVGYWSVKYGATGIEIGENSTLSGNSDPATLDELINQISGGPQAGNNVELTLDPNLQRVAYDGLAASNTGQGSAVAIDPKTGDILAMVSYPSFDANNIDERFQELQQDPNKPLLNRATQGLYTPGSVMKVITAAAALKAGVKPTDIFFDSGRYETPGYTVVNYGDASYGRVTFAQALALSINVVFAKVAVEDIGAQLLYDTAKNFGFGDTYENFPLEINPSTLGVPVSDMVGGTLAQTSFGQDRVQSNVFEFANVAAAIANDGRMMEPRIVKEIRSPEGIILDKPAPSTRADVIDRETALTLQDMMVGVVDEGSATGAQIPGVKVAGKTGTAEVPPRDPNSWFIAFAPADDPKIAVAVLVENGGDGEKQALPIARQIIEASLKTGGG
ncbi:MAG TPA: penicillin-binding protein 2 [Rubrobacteraceae bacterium]|nr:penicillin-binding protein 2 [Rubrobacteraceae bacterium]